MRFAQLGGAERELAAKARTEGAGVTEPAPLGDLGDGEVGLLGEEFVGGIESAPGEELGRWRPSWCAWCSAAFRDPDRRMPPRSPP